MNVDKGRPSAGRQVLEGQGWDQRTPNGAPNAGRHRIGGNVVQLVMD